MSVLQLTRENFDFEALQTNETVLIDFWAPWCGPCKMLSPIIDEVAAEAADYAKVCKVNIDEEPELAAQYGVMSIPTLVVVRNGEQVTNAVGVHPKEAILALLKD